MAKSRRKKSECLNCFTKYPEENNYCPNCGQENHDRRVKFRFLIGDFLADYFTFDSKILRSLGPLLFRPGKLTREFNAGHRVKFIPPLRMYIFISIIYFALLHTASKMDNEEGPVEVEPDTTELTQIGDSTDAVVFMQGDSVVTASGNLTVSFGDTLTTEFFSRPDQRALIDSLGVEGYLDHLEVEDEFERAMFERMINMVQNGEEFGDYMLRNASYMMFFFIPVFALLFMLFCRKRKMYYVEHVVFTLHFHSFAMFFASVLYAFSILFFDVYDSLWYFPICFIYLLISMKRVYEYSWFGTVWRWLVLTLLYPLVLMIFLIALFLVTFFLL